MINAKKLKLAEKDDCIEQYKLLLKNKLEKDYRLKRNRINFNINYVFEVIDETYLLYESDHKHGSDIDSEDEQEVYNLTQVWFMLNI